MRARCYVRHRRRWGGGCNCGNCASGTSIPTPPLTRIPPPSAPLPTRGTRRRSRSIFGGLGTAATVGNPPVAAPGSSGSPDRHPLARLPFPALPVPPITIRSPARSTSARSPPYSHSPSLGSPAHQGDPLSLPRHFGGLGNCCNRGNPPVAVPGPSGSPDRHPFTHSLNQRSFNIHLLLPPSSLVIIRPPRRPPVLIPPFLASFRTSPPALSVAIAADLPQPVHSSGVSTWLFRCVYHLSTHRGSRDGIFQLTCCVSSPSAAQDASRSPNL